MRILYLVCSCWLIVFSVPLAVTAQTISEKTRALESLMRGKQWDSALKLAQEIHADYPDNQRISYDIGLINNKLEHYADAVAPLTLAVQEPPDEWREYQELATALRNLERDNEALDILNRALDLWPRQSELLYHRGSVYIKLYKPDNALADFNAVLKLLPNQTDALFMSGLAYRMKSEPAVAERLFNQVIERNRDHFGAHKNVADLAYKRDQFARAEKHARIALKHRPDFIDAYWVLARSLIAQQKYQDAITALFDLLKYDTENAAAYVMLSKIYIQLERWQQARLAALQAVQFDDSLIEGYFNLGVIAAQFQESEAEIDYYYHVLELNPTYLPAHINLGLIYKSQGKWTEALRHFDAAFRLVPNDPFVIRQAGEIYVTTQNFDAARQMYDLLKQLDADSAEELQQQIDAFDTKR